MEIQAGERKVDLIFELPGVSIYILADAQQMEQALINVVKNAIEAIDQNGTVTFTIDADARQLIVTDNGTGISAAQSEQLFTPFYSTKKDGQGIGLTLVREILINHGFEFSLKTVTDGQTEFRITW